MSRVFLRKQFSNYLGEQRAIDDIIVFFQPDGPSPSPTPTPVPVTPTPTPTITPTNTLTPTPTQTKTPTPTPSFVSYSGLFCSGNTQNDACFCVNPSVTLYSSQPFYTLSQQVYTDAGLTNQISVGLFLSSGGTAYEYQYIYFNPSLEIVGSCPTPTPTITSTPTNTPTVTNTPSVTSTVTPTITSTVTPTVTTTPTVTPTLTTTPNKYNMLFTTGSTESDACSSIITKLLYSNQPFYTPFQTVFNEPSYSTFPPIGYYANSGIVYYWDGFNFVSQGACPSPTVTPTNTSSPTPTLTPTNTPTPTEPGGYKLLAESGANLQSETPDDINIEH